MRPEVGRHDVQRARLLDGTTGAGRARGIWPASLNISERKVILVLGDLAVVNGTALLSLLLGSRWTAAGPVGFAQQALSYAAWFAALSLLWVFAARINECYDIRGTANLFVAGRRLLLAVSAMATVFIVVYYFVQLPLLPRSALLIYLPSSFALLLLWRWSYLLVFRKPVFQHRILIVGAGWSGRTIASELQRYLKGEYTLLGFIDDDPLKQGQVVEGARVLGTQVDLLRLVRGLER